jgi:ribosomal protein S11
MKLSHGIEFPAAAQQVSKQAADQNENVMIQSLSLSVSGYLERKSGNSVEFTASAVHISSYHSVVDGDVTEF